MTDLKIFTKKTVLITGGTGSFGNAMTSRLIKSKVGEIRIFSRDEKKQDDMRKKFNNRKIKFFIGDVRDFSTIQNASKLTDYIFHAAALKQVPSCEFFPLEAVKTNVIGTENTLNAALVNKVKKIICLSTDKAVSPINSMGLTKSLMEKIIIAKSREFENSSTSVCITRYGNVISSRGSVIPLFLDQIKNRNNLTVTNLDMTRFMMSLDEAIDLVFFAFLKGGNGDIFVKKSPSASIRTIIQSLEKILHVKCKIKLIGLRHGEKFHETLMSKEERRFSKDFKEYYKILSDNRDLNYEKYFSKGNIKKNKNFQDYTSENTKRLNVLELSKILKPIIEHKS